MHAALACDTVVAGNTGVVSFQVHMFSTCRVPPSIVKARHCGSAYLLFEGSPCCSVSWLFPVDITQSKCVTVLVSRGPLAAFIVSSLFGNDHSEWWETATHSFDCSSLSISDLKPVSYPFDKKEKPHSCLSNPS